MQTLVLPSVKCNCILNYFMYFRHNNNPIKFPASNFTFLNFKGEGDIIYFFKLSLELI